MGGYSSNEERRTVSVVSVTVGDILSSDAQTLTNTVNCVGVMGKGVALAFKNRFPEMYRDYVERCRRHEVRLGKPYLYKHLYDPWILNFPTKDHWRAVSKLSDIVEGLSYLTAHYKEWGITSLAVPPLGCGNGQLDWNVVGPTLYRCFNEFNIPVNLYAPIGTPTEQLSTSFLKRETGSGLNEELRHVGTHLPPEQVALVAVVSRITREPHHRPVGRTTFQKIAYFLTEAGVPTKLRHNRGSYGPFSSELKPLVSKLMNHDVVVERKRGQMFEIIPGPTYSDARTLYMDSLKRWAPAIERVADLFLRMPRTHDAEIAATVHFAAKDLRRDLNRRPSEREVLDEVKRWKTRRRPKIDENEIAEAVRNLNLLRWVDLEPTVELPVSHDDPMYS
jgi:O-acetyl-ADP-ribose deacetylase (regulator of RNase III)